MRCEDALDRLLEAEPAELTGGGDGQLATHVRACARCRAIAGVLVEELNALDRELDRFAARPDAAAAADAALAASRAVPEPRTRPEPAGRAGRWARRAPVPLAVAAALAALLLARDPSPPRAPGAGPASPRGEATRVAVRPPPGRSAAVMATADPRITIIWLYEREGT